MRINKGQRNFDGLPLTTLQAMQTALQQVYTNRTSGNGLGTTATEELIFGGFALRCVTLEEIADQLADVANAIQKKLPGATFTTPTFGGGSDGGYGWPGCR